jgi:RimJ/RimL family protein N-acetyltransferase
VVRERTGAAAMGYVQATVLADGEALIAYEFASRFWGLGYAREAVAAMMQELSGAYGVRRVGAVFKKTNHRSRKLLGRLGMATAPPGGFPARFAGDDEDALVRALAD